jgi:hypothetical protein
MDALNNFINDAAYVVQIENRKEQLTLACDIELLAKRLLEEQPEEATRLEVILIYFRIAVLGGSLAKTRLIGMSEKIIEEREKIDTKKG